MTVIDASALIDVLLQTEAGERVEPFLVPARLSAPHLLDAEVFHRVVNLAKHGLIDGDEARRMIAELRVAPITRVDHRRLLDAATVLSVALSGYDALYAALARTADTALLTTDDRLARTARDQFGITVVDLDAAG